MPLSRQGVVFSLNTLETPDPCCRGAWNRVNSFQSVGWILAVSSVGANQGHRIKIGGLGRMANSAFGGKLNLCGTCSHLFTIFVVYLVVDNKYNIYVR